MSGHGRPFEIEEIDRGDQVVVLSLSGDFASYLADQFVKHRNPAVKALAYNLNQSASILSGFRVPEQVPHLKDVVINHDASSDVDVGNCQPV